MFGDSDNIYLLGFMSTAKFDSHVLLAILAKCLAVSSFFRRVRICNILHASSFMEIDFPRSNHEEYEFVRVISRKGRTTVPINLSVLPKQ